MKRIGKAHINKRVVVLSAVTGVVIWLLSRGFYSAWNLKMPGLFMIPVLCTSLFIALFATVWVGSMLTGSFDRESNLYSGGGTMLRYMTLGILCVFASSMLLEFLYELNPNKKIIEPTSYIFVIDESGSMSGNDPNGLRYEAIKEIMNSQDNQLPYMVYSFASEPRVLRNMGVLEANEKVLPVTCDGGTAIFETTLRILQDYKDGKWKGGNNPKIIFLTDGFATDLDNRFLWFKGNIPEFNVALEEYSDMGINISTVGLGTVDKNLMRKMAETTGGVFICVDQASDLAPAMKAAATSYSERNLLSIRYMKHGDRLFGFLRVLFLGIIGTLIGGSMLFAYMEDSSIPIIIATSLAGAFVGSLLFEIGVQHGIYQNFLWLILWLMYSSTVGFIYPAKRSIGGRKQCRDGNGFLEHGQEINNINVRV